MSTDLDISLGAASVYAGSLLELANESGQADAVGAELADLRALWERDAALVGLMSSAAIDMDARRASLKKIFSGRVSQLVFNLLMVLNDKRRAMILPWVCDAFRLKFNEQRGRREAVVTTAVAMDDAQRATVREQVKRLSGWDAILVERVDAGVLGGLVIQVGDHVYDATVRRRIRDYEHGLHLAVRKFLQSGVSRFMTEG